MSRTRLALSPIASPRWAAGTHWLMIIDPSRGARGAGRGAWAVRRARRLSVCRLSYVRGLRIDDVVRCSLSVVFLRVFRTAHRALRTALGQCLIQRRPVLSQLLEPLELIELLPEVPRDFRRVARREFDDLIDESQERLPEVLPAEPQQRRVLRRENCLFKPAIIEDRRHDLRHFDRILGVVEHAAAVHRCRHGGGRVGEHRHAFVEPLDQRHAEALVLAGAQEQIGHVVQRGELLVPHVSEEVHVGCTEPRYQLLQHGEVFFEPAVQIRPAAGANAGCAGFDRRGRR